ncbi:MAG: prolyl oligopeptidase family serine peptidase [Planctomycetes bacterium]|nr:prolyl oligopeptidase family serine peptidase [Planctomycetota bacterium]
MDRYVANSPLHLVKGMNTPLLLGVGRKDDNVNWRQSLYFFNALRALGKPTEMVLYPTAGHGFAFVEFRRRVDRFLDEFLKPGQ